jgi:hypothetical protein
VAVVLAVSLGAVGGGILGWQIGLMGGRHDARYVWTITALVGGAGAFVIGAAAFKATGGRSR